MNSKQKFLRFICMAELLTVLGFYFLSPDGLRKVLYLHHENRQLQSKIDHIQEKIAVLEQEIFDWTHDYFNIEQYAREKLAMGHKDETVYIIA